MPPKNLSPFWKGNTNTTKASPEQKQLPNKGEADVEHTRTPPILSSEGITGMEQQPGMTQYPGAGAGPTGFGDLAPLMSGAAGPPSQPTMEVPSLHAPEDPTDPRKPLDWKKMLQRGARGFLGDQRSRPTGKLYHTFL